MYHSNYLFTPDETICQLGQKDGEAFNAHYGIRKDGNFENKSILNLLNSDPADHSFDIYLPQLRQYRKKRCQLHLDDKILTAWNALMIAAMCQLYRVSKNPRYLDAAKKADRFIQEHLCLGDQLFASFRNGKRGENGFQDDYAGYIFAQLTLYEATLEKDIWTGPSAFVDMESPIFRTMRTAASIPTGREASG